MQLIYLPVLVATMVGAMASTNNNRPVGGDYKSHPYRQNGYRPRRYSPAPDRHSVNSYKYKPTPSYNQPFSYATKPSYSSVPPGYSSPNTPSTGYSSPANNNHYSSPASQSEYSSSSFSYSSPPSDYSLPASGYTSTRQVSPPYVAAPASSGYVSPPTRYSPPPAEDISISFSVPTDYSSVSSSYPSSNSYSNNGNQIPIVDFRQTIRPTTHEYSVAFQTGNGIKSQEVGFLKSVPYNNNSNGNYEGAGYEAGYQDGQSGVANVKIGATSWCSPDGKLVTLEYTADEKGYEPQITMSPCFYSGQGSSYSN